MLRNLWRKLWQNEELIDHCKLEVWTDEGYCPVPLSEKVFPSLAPAAVKPLLLSFGHIYRLNFGSAFSEGTAAAAAGQLSFKLVNLWCPPRCIRGLSNIWIFRSERNIQDNGGNNPIVESNHLLKTEFILIPDVDHSVDCACLFGLQVRGLLGGMPIEKTFIFAMP